MTSSVEISKVLHRFKSSSNKVRNNNKVAAYQGGSQRGIDGFEVKNFIFLEKNFNSP